MRICLIDSTPLNRFGGMAWSQLRIAGLLRDAGHEVHLVRMVTAITQEEWETTTATVSDVGGADLQAFEIRPWLCAPETPYADHELITALEQLDERFDYDLFHCLGLGQSSYMALQAAKHKPVILSARGSDINQGRLRFNRLTGLMWMLQRADLLTFVSEAIRDRADLLVPCKDRSTVILNSTDEKYFVQSPITPYDKRGSFILGGIGDFTLKKGADLIAYVLQTLNEQNLRVKLYWVGAQTNEDPHQGRFATTIQRFIDNGTIHLTGIVPHESVLDHLKLADIFVLPSLDEGCPNGLLEAMLARRPIVTVNVGAVPEIVRHQQEAIIVPPYDAEAIIKVVKELFSRPDRRLALGQAAYERVTTFCTTDKETNAWLKVYEHALIPKSHRYRLFTQNGGHP